MPDTTVDVELLLAVDVSASISTGEFSLQKTGIAQAFTSSSVIARITAGTQGSIAACVVYWAGNITGTTSAAGAVIGVPWTQISNSSEAGSFAIAVNDSTRPLSSGSTGIGTFTFLGDGLNFSVNQFTNNSFIGIKKVIDLSGDGGPTLNGDSSERTSESTVIMARTKAINSSIGINALAIEDLEDDLLEYFQSSVITPSGFGTAVQNYSSFGVAIGEKIYTELLPPNSSWKFMGGDIFTTLTVSTSPWICLPVTTEVC